MKHPSFHLLLSSLITLALAASAFGFGQEGHEIVGEIAQEYLQGTPAGQHVRTLLGSDTLAHAATWADRIRGGPIDSDSRVFLAAGTGNLQTHTGRHFCDVPFQVGVYHLGALGTSQTDIVQSMKLCIGILRNPTAPKPAGWTEKIALMLLAHYMGDLHQPLHVGAAYVTDNQLVNPRESGTPPFEATRGGNWLTYPLSPRNTGHSTGSGDNLHHFWDTNAVLTAMGTQTPVQYAAVLKQNAHRGFGWSAGGDPLGWPEKWANTTLKLSKTAYAGVQLGNRHIVPATPPSKPHPEWDVTGMRPHYDEFAVKAVNAQMARGGYRLAELLKAIWP